MLELQRFGWERRESRIDSRLELGVNRPIKPPVMLYQDKHHNVPLRINKTCKTWISLHK